MDAADAGLQIILETDRRIQSNQEHEPRTYYY
jgi:hypothetical protein